MYHTHEEPLPTMSERVAEYGRAHAIAAAEDGRPCPCGTNGWILSPFDTWEPCPMHPQGPHPEDYEFEEEGA